MPSSTSDLLRCSTAESDRQLILRTVHHHASELNVSSREHGAGVVSAREGESGELGEAGGTGGDLIMRGQQGDGAERVGLFSAQREVSREVANTIASLSRPGGFEQAERRSAAVENSIQLCMSV